jgi:hypothetical protein
MTWTSASRRIRCHRAAWPSEVFNNVDPSSASLKTLWCLLVYFQLAKLLLFFLR